MYNVSSAVKNAYKLPVSVHHIRGVIKMPVQDVNFTAENILAGSCSVSNKCADTDTLIGTVYVGELRISFLNNLNIERGAWKQQEIRVEYGIEVNDSITWIPMGIYYVSKANHSASGISITAYDAMQKFDKRFGLSTTTGNIYDLLRLACSTCNVSLGMTEAEVSALPNSNELLVLYSENDIETWRDFISWVAQTCGTFATINRSGQLVLRRYKTEVDETIPPNDRANDGSFSDFTTKITGISVVEKESGHTRYYGDPDDDTGTTYNLGTNPLMQNIVRSRQERMCRAILAELEKIRYVPFSVSILENPLYDLGDVISFTEGIANGAHCCVMGYTVNYGRTSALNGVGSDPALANARSKTDKNIAGLLTNTEENKLQYYTFTNAEDIRIGVDRERSIINIRFATVSSQHVTFQAEVLLDADCETEMDCTVKYRKNGTLQSYRPIERWIDGRHILSLFFPIVVEPNTVYNWVVYLHTGSGSVDIAARDVNAVIWGQGLAAVTEWDGYIDIFDRVKPVELVGDLGIKEFSAVAVAGTKIPEKKALTARVTKLPLDSVGVKPFAEVVAVGKDLVVNHTWDEIAEHTWAELEDGFIWG